jgi:hypothetical protein
LFCFVDPLFFGFSLAVDDVAELAIEGGTAQQVRASTAASGVNTLHVSLREWADTERVENTQTKI